MLRNESRKVRCNPQTPAEPALLRPHKLHDAARNVPILDIEVAIFVPVGTMRAAKNTFKPLVLRDVEIEALRRIGIVAEDGDDRVVLVENVEPTVQVRH